jgi:hypothetical protein
MSSEAGGQTATIAVRYRLKSHSAFPFFARSINSPHRYGLAAAGA